MAEASYRERYYGHVGGDDQLRLIQIEAKARQAVALNNTFIAIPTPTAAQVRDHSKIMARELNGVFRLLFGDFTADDT